MEETRTTHSEFVKSGPSTGWRRGGGGRRGREEVGDDGGDGGGALVTPTNGAYQR